MNSQLIAILKDCSSIDVARRLTSKDVLERLNDLCIRR
jgi:hypothetical protein